MNVDLDQAITAIADQFRAIKARNPRWSSTSVPLVDIQEQFDVSRDDAIALRSLAFDEVAPRLIELVGEQRPGRGPDKDQRASKSGYVDRLALAQSAWLADPHVSVEEIARLVDVHPATARNYLRQLRAASLMR